MHQTEAGVSNLFSRGLLFWATYVVNLGKLQFMLVFVVEARAVLVDEAHHGCLPPRRSQESNDHIEEPVLSNPDKANVSFR